MRFALQVWAIVLLLPINCLIAQAPGSVSSTPGRSSSQNSNSSSRSSSSSSQVGPGESSFLGKDVPVFNPGTEIVQWDGQTWNINDNRFFEARFEKYLNAPESVSRDDREYQGILATILDNLAPGRITPQSTDEAFKLLAKASKYNADANLCDALANQVYASWLARRNNARLASANNSLEDERKRLEWNAQITAQSDALQAPVSDSEQGRQQQQLHRDMEMQPILTRLAEVNALMKVNQAKREVAELQVKIEFQALLIQLFLQRRFQHVVIGTRFYRSIFADGDSLLRVGDDAKDLFAKTSGLPPTLGTLDSMANEVMRDVREGVSAFNYLLEMNELESATKRLAETFLVGEYMPEIRTLERSKKRQALAFVQRSNKLLSAIQVKDYALAERLVKELAETATDFDSSKPLAVIETAKTVSAMHLAKARNAAVSGNRQVLETELKAATEIWPRNPALAEVSRMIFSQADVQSRALVDFDQLVAQKNHRQIFDDRMRFIAATAMHPQKQEQLRKILEDMGAVEAAIIRAREIEKRGDFAGAWESTEITVREFPDDNKLNQLRADLTTKAADFVQAIRKAEDLEQRGQPGSSLAWYLKAQREYPPSDFARDGIQRVTAAVLPDAR